MQRKLSGVFTPNLVPLKDNGEINEPELRRYVDWLIDRGVHGLYPNGSTGEFTRFTVEERRRIIRLVCEQCVPRGVPVLAGAAEANVKETIFACEAYHDYGATAVAIVAPFYYKLSSAAVYSYFKEIANHSPIDVTLYNIPMFASPIDVPTITRLAEECPRIVGIKDSSGDVANMLRMISAIRPHRPEFCFLTGWEAVLVPMMMIGCDGGTHATSGVVPELTRRIYDLASRGQYVQAMPLQAKLVELFDVMLHSIEFPEGFRAGVELRGFSMGRGRQPLDQSQRVDLERIRQSLSCIMSEFGVVDPPAEGCLARHRSGSVDLPGELMISQIAQAVAKTLQAQRMTS